MTKEEAIEFGKRVFSLTPFDEMREFCEIAVKVLEQQPCGDCISRQAVLDVMKKRDEELSSICPKDIRELPPVTPQPKIGRWMECGGDEPWLKGYCCSLCNFTTTQKYDYCTCGAKMIEPQESDE
jgi:hypothetical protein